MCTWVLCFGVKTKNPPKLSLNLAHKFIVAHKLIQIQIYSASTP